MILQHINNSFQIKSSSTDSWGANLVLRRLYSKGQNEEVLLSKKRTELDSICLFWLSKIRTFGRGQNKDVSLGKKRTELRQFLNFKLSRKRTYLN